MKRIWLSWVIVLVITLFTLTSTLSSKAGDNKEDGKGYSIEHLVPNKIVLIKIETSSTNPTKVISEAIKEIGEKYNIVPGGFTITQHYGVGSRTSGVILFIASSPKF